MNKVLDFFKRRTAWSNAELVIIKISLLSAGLLAGIYGYGVLKEYIDYIWILAVAACTAAFYMWLSKLKA